MGKSTLLVNLFIEHIRQGNGGLFIDPHGDTADQIAKLIPKSRMRDFIWIEPDASLVPPFNPLHFNSPEELELGKESLFTTFKSLAGTAWGDESARVIINAIDAVCERQRSHATDYDIVCTMEGPEIDFRSDLGRYFIVECKDWSTPADFSAFAKFCRVLDSTKCRFGILCSRLGITGTGHNSDAEREHLKVFQDRGMVVVVLSLSDLTEISTGANLITLLRERYETVRLDLKRQQT